MHGRKRTIWSGVLLAGLAACGDNNNSGDDDPIDAPGRDGAAVDAPATDGTPPIDSPPPIDADDTDAPPASPLILRYAFEDSGTVVTDGSGRGMNGTLSDAAASTSNGRTGRGLTLNGANPATQFVSVPSGVLTGVDAFTIATWVNVTTNTPWTRIYDFGNGMPDPANRFMFMTVSGFVGPAVGLHTTSYGGSPQNETMASARALLPTGVWKHVAISGVGGERRLYVDGFPVAVVTGAASVPPGEMEPLADHSWIGKSRFPDPGFDGRLDEFRIYNEQLSPAAIQDLAWPGNDYSYWRFDENTGLTAVDSSDGPVPTVLMGGATWVDGRLGSAVDLAGGTSDQHVVMSTSPLAGCTDSMTVAAWVKVEAHADWARVFDFGTNNTKFTYLAPRDGGGVMRFAMIAPTGTLDLTAPAALPADNDWHHVAVTVDASMVRLYADGLEVVSVASPTVRPGDFNDTTQNYLGKSRFPDPGLNGSIDELRISCRAYTADEIKMLSAR